MRCRHCRNPIKEHQAAIGATEGARTYHQDCWPLAQAQAERDGGQQEEYERRIAAGGLAALLSPYVSPAAVPGQRQVDANYL